MYEKQMRAEAIIKAWIMGMIMVMVEFGNGVVVQ